MGVLKTIGKAVLGLAVTIGVIGRVAPHLFMSVNTLYKRLLSLVHCRQNILQLCDPFVSKR